MKKIILLSIIACMALLGNVTLLGKGPQNDLYKAVDIDDYKVVDNALKKGAAISAKVLVHATALRNKKMIDYLLKKGGDINAELPYIYANFEKVTPLFWAANVGNLPMVKFLIKKGANIREYDIKWAKEKVKKYLQKIKEAKEDEIERIRFLEEEEKVVPSFKIKQRGKKNLKMFKGL